MASATRRGTLLYCAWPPSGPSSWRQLEPLDIIQPDELNSFCEVSFWILDFGVDGSAACAEGGTDAPFERQTQPSERRRASALETIVMSVDFGSAKVRLVGNPTLKDIGSLWRC